MNARSKVGDLCLWHLCVVEHYSQNFKRTDGARLIINEAREKVEVNLSCRARSHVVGVSIECKLGGHDRLSYTIDLRLRRHLRVINSMVGVATIVNGVELKSDSILSSIGCSYSMKRLQKVWIRGATAFNSCS